jgi:hypothetical protein
LSAIRRETMSGLYLRSNSVLLSAIAALSLPSCLTPTAPVTEPTAAPKSSAPAMLGVALPKLTIEPTKNGDATAKMSLTIDAGHTLRTVNKAWFLGTNIAIWNQPATYLDPEVRRQFKDAGIGLVRIPGGSASDQYFWNGNGVRQGDTVDRSRYKNGTWKVDYSKWTPGFMGFFGFPRDPMQAELNNWHGDTNVKEQHDFVKSLGADTLVCVNAGTGTPRDAAEWVKWAGKQGFGVKFWEVGNELGGSWEAGTLRADGKTMDRNIYGKIYRDFSKAIKAADPKVLVGSQGGVDFIQGALAQKDAPVDFVTYHDYFSSDAPTPTALFKTLEKIRPAIAEVRDAVQKLRPGKEILVGMTEFNAQLFEGSQTSDINSGLWLTSALLEMMGGGLDFATQWDSFTQKQDKGGGHGFMIEQGALPKAEYYTYVILNHYFGETLIQAEDTQADVRSYASRDSAGNLYAILINTAQSTGYDVDLKLSGAKVAPVADCVRFSEREYTWDPKAFTTPWNSGPREIRIQALGKKVQLLPASLLACKFRPEKTAATLDVLGPTRLNLAKSTESAFEVLALTKEGKPAAGATIRATGAAGFTPQPTEAKADNEGRAQFTVSAPATQGEAQIQLTADGTSGSLLSVVSVEPELLLRAASNAATREATPVIAALRFKQGARYTLIDSFNHSAAIETPAAGVSKLTMRHGLAAFAVTSTEATKLALSFKVRDLSSPLEIEFFEKAMKDKVVYQFDDSADLKNASGKAAFQINPNIRPNQGVLEITLKDAEGWTQDVFALDKFNDIPNFDRAGIQGVSFDLGTSDNFDISNNWAQLVVVLQSEANYWMPLDFVDLSGFQKNQFKRITIPLKPEFQKAMVAFFKIILVVNSGAKVNGSLYLDNLGFQIQSKK